MSSSPTPPVDDPAGYAFGDFLVDPRRRLLWRHRLVVPVGGKTFDLLLHLLRHRDRIVEKDELLSRIWPDAVVQENNLVRQMSNLRRALHQRLDQHDLIVTVSGRGYRFVGQVTPLDALPAGLPLSPSETAPHTPDGPAPAAEAEGPVDAPRGPVDLVGTEAAGRAPTRSVAETRAGGRVRGVVAAAAVLAVVAAGMWAVRVMTPQAAPLRTLRQLTYDMGLQQEPTWAPDGRRLAYVADRDGQSDIWVQAIDEPTPIRITTSPAPDWQPDWSPDGRWIVFRSQREGGGLFVVSSTGGEARRLATFGFRPRWSPDGLRVLFYDTDATDLRRQPYVVAADGGDAAPVRPDLVDRGGEVIAAWVPDGRVSLLTRRGPRATLEITKVEAGAPVLGARIAPAVQAQLASVDVGAFVWARSGRHVFFEGQMHDASNLWRVRVGSSFEWVSVERLTVATGREVDLALSPDGTQIAFTSSMRRTKLWSFPFDVASAQLTGEGVPVTSNGAAEFDAATTTDGSKLAYRTTRTGRQELWEHSVAAGRDRLLFATQDWRMSSPRFSRDGTHIAYRQVRNVGVDGQPESFVAILRTDSGLGRAVRFAGDDTIVPDDWSPDGQLLLGACRVGAMTRYGVCVMPAASSSERATLSLLASDPTRTLICQRFSPDQRWISFIATDGNRSTIYVMPSTGGAWIPVSDGASYDDKPHWAADGRTLFFVSNRGGLLNLWARRFDPASGQPVGGAFRVTTFDDQRRRLAPNLGRVEIAVARDRLFMPVSETTGNIWILDRVDR